MYIFIVFLIIIIIIIIILLIIGRSDERYINTIWHELSERRGGKFIKGGFFTKRELEIKHREWIVTLGVDIGNEDSGPNTIIEAPFVSKDGFYFKIYRKSIFSGIGKIFGMKCAQIGIPQFDNAFIIKGNDEEKLKQLFKNSKIRALISHQYDFPDNFPLFIKRNKSDRYVLYFRASGEIKDIARLEDLFDLFAEILDQLYFIGSAYSSHKFDPMD